MCDQFLYSHYQTTYKKIYTGWAERVEYTFAKLGALGKDPCYMVHELYGRGGGTGDLLESSVSLMLTAYGRAERIDTDFIIS